MIGQLVTPPPVKFRRFGKRHRRIVKTAAVVFAVALIGGLAWWKIDRDNRPEQYEPGESSADITSTVSEQHSKNTAPSSPAPAGPAVNKEARKSDPLRDAGEPLPSGAPAPRFTDVTRQAGLGGFRTFAGNRTSQLPEDMGSGLAWGDFDNDGNDDLFVVSAGGPLGVPASQLAPSILYRTRGDGTFEKAAGFPDLRIHGMGAAWADYNNDGWLDLVVTGIDTILLFRNDHGHFVRDRALPSPNGFWTGASWGDYDRDGKPDLYICGYVRYVPSSARQGAASQQFGFEVPYTLNPASYEPERNLLFHNNGDGTFTEVAGKLGVANQDGRSLSALWHDFNGDGWPDLYVANDVSENKLYLNRRGRFVEAGKQAWVAEYRGSMGLAAGDFDRDGDDDLFIAHWVAQQYALYQNLTREQSRAAKQGARAVDQELHFTDVAEIRGIGQPSLQRIGWGASFFDFDSDGWLDLAVANGSTFETKDARKRLEPMPSFLFWNERGQFFRDLASWNRSLAAPHVSRGLAVADYNNDGAVDIAIVDLDGGVRLLRNDVPQGNWIELRLHGARSAFGDGATVTVWADGAGLRRTVGSASYLSQDSRRVHAGIGKASKIDRIEILWPDGKLETRTGIGINRIVDVREGEAPAAPEAPVPTARTLTQKETAQFWNDQRAGMDAIKKEHDYARAARFFQAALELNPAHEDSRYYLANCLTAQGNASGAIEQLETLTRMNPQSHRGWQRKGELQAASAQSRAELRLAADSLETALRLNPEETGTLLLSGEVALARGNPRDAARRFELACQANPRAVGGLFLRAYVASRAGDTLKAKNLLIASQAARGKEWKPRGAMLEGDVQRRMFREAGFLSVFWEEWDGSPDPRTAFAGLDRFLDSRFR